MRTYFMPKRWWYLYLVICGVISSEVVGFKFDNSKFSLLNRYPLNFKSPPFITMQTTEYHVVFCIDHQEPKVRHVCRVQ